MAEHLCDAEAEHLCDAEIKQYLSRLTGYLHTLFKQYLSRLTGY